MNDEELDRFISRSLEMQELDVPTPLRESVRRRAAALAVRPRPMTRKRLALWGSMAAAALLVAAASLLLLFPPRPPGKRITQIRTEFSIPDKNIRIVWVQRGDFRLPDANG